MVHLSSYLYKEGCGEADGKMIDDLSEVEELLDGLSQMIVMATESNTTVDKSLWMTVFVISEQIRERIHNLVTTEKWKVGETNEESSSSGSFSNDNCME